MSRIEKAMERAAQLRQGNVPPALTQLQEPEPGPVHIPSSAASAAERIIPRSPFIVNLDEPYSPIGEEFRKLKSALVQLTKGDLFHNVILVTSAVKNEGKSITALNLAISLAQEYDHTVLLIDADFRGPSIHRYLGIEQKKGFSNYLFGEVQIGEVIIPTGIGRLSVITGGREVPNPVELFASQKTEALIAEMKHRYNDRFIIFDSPPVLPFAETRTLAHLADGVLLVVKEQLPSQKNVREAIDALKGSRLLGMVYNDTLIDRQDEMYSSYHRYNRAEK